MSFSAVNILGTMPEIYLTFFGCILLILETMVPKEKRPWLAYFTIIGLVFAMVASIGLNGKGLPLYSGLYIIDPFSNFFKITIYAAAIITVLLSLPYLEQEDIHIGEYYAFLLFSVVGMMVMVSAGDLITLFLGIELMSLCFYVLVGLKRDSTRSVEAAFKYFLLGAFSAAILLFGISFLYGAAGTETISGLANFINNPGALKPMVIVGMILTLVGFTFKVSAVPFHMWTPDVYEGAPTVVTGFMAAAAKIAAFGVFLRVFWVAFSGNRHDWDLLIILISILSMAVGNLVAILQTNLKRMLAYSSIGHAGYALMGLLLPNRESLFALLFYVFTYMFMTLGAFGVILMMRKKGVEGEDISDFTGLHKRGSDNQEGTPTVLQMVFSGHLDQFFSHQNATEERINHAKRKKALQECHRCQRRKQDHPQKVGNGVNEKKTPVFIVNDDCSKTDKSPDGTNDPSFHLQVAYSWNITPLGNLFLTRKFFLRWLFRTRLFLVPRLIHPLLASTAERMLSRKSPISFP